MTTGGEEEGAFSARGAPGRSCSFVGTKKARGTQHTSFCYSVGEGEKDGGIILMA